MDNSQLLPLNIGILAHVDAGKTTLTEQLLYASGQIRNLGTVDAGTTVSDKLPLEQKRGISIQTGVSGFTWKQQSFNIIDTPGHADFAAEVERSLMVLDVAILMVSAVEGFQAHTYNILELLEEHDTPTIVVVNKLDRAGADFEMVLEEMVNDLKLKPFTLYVPNVLDGVPSALLHQFSNETEANQKWKEQSIECLAEFDEEVLNSYLEGEALENTFLLTKLAQNISAKKLIPLIPMIAKDGLGVDELMQVLLELIQKPSYGEKESFTGLVFKVEHDKKLGRLAHIKVLGGVLNRKQEVFNAQGDLLGKVGGIQQILGNQKQECQHLLPGQIGIVSGLSKLVSGEILGVGNKLKLSSFKSPVLTVQVVPVREEDYAELAAALSIMNDEDPKLQFTWYKAEREMHLKLMGPMQMEVLDTLIEERFGINVEFKDPTVIYKETITTVASGKAVYTMPKPCWAIVEFKVEPAALGSGIQYTSKVSVDKIAAKYQNEIEQTIPKALKQGVLGWEHTDLNITLIDGEDHEIHSRPGDFILATPMALLKAINNAEPQFLEPMYAIEIKASDALLGKISGELSQLRAAFGNPSFEDGKFTLKGEVPVSTALDLPIKINAITGGKGKLKLSFGGYQPCSRELGVERKRVGVNPLDESQWILHKRGAFKVDEMEF